MPDAASAAKRSIMLPSAPMPFWHIVKVVCSSVYQIKILCDEGFLIGGGGLYRPNARWEGEFEWLKTLQAGELQKIFESWGQKTFTKIVKTAPTLPNVIWEGFKKNSPSSSKNNLQHIQLSDTTGTSNGTGFYGQVKQKKIDF